LSAATASEMPVHERPISEEFRLVALKYADAENAADILYGTKKDVLEQLKENIMSGADKMPENKAERLARCSSEWKDFKTKMFDARSKSRRLSLQLRYIEMKHKEQNRNTYHSSAEMRLGR
jgi:hypothetical protein